MERNGVFGNCKEQQNTSIKHKYEMCYYSFDIWILSHTHDKNKLNDAVILLWSWLLLALFFLIQKSWNGMIHTPFFSVHSKTFWFEHNKEMGFSLIWRDSETNCSHLHSFNTLCILYFMSVLWKTKYTEHINSCKRGNRAWKLNFWIFSNLLNDDRIYVLLLQTHFKKWYDKFHLRSWKRLWNKFHCKKEIK